MTGTVRPLEAQSTNQSDDSVRYGMLFDSVRWSYPVHAFIGKILRDSRYNIDYYDTEQFERYCCLVNELLNDKVYVVTDDDIKVIAHDVLNCFSSKPQKELTTFTKEAAMFLLGAYNKETFEYLIMSFTIKLKTRCLLVVLQKISKIMYSAKMSRDIEMRREKFREDQIAILNMETRKAAACLDCLNVEGRISPMENLSVFNAIIQRSSLALLPITIDSHTWEDYLLRECDAQLDWILNKEKSEFVMRVIDCRHLLSYLKEGFKVTGHSKSLNNITKLRENMK